MVSTFKKNVNSSRPQEFDYYRRFEFPALSTYRGVCFANDKIIEVMGYLENVVGDCL